MSLLCWIGEFVTNWPWLTLGITITLALSVCDPPLSYHSYQAAARNQLRSLVKEHHRPEQQAYSISDKDQPLVVLPSTAASTDSPVKSFTIRTRSGEKVSFHSVEPEEYPVIADYRHQLEAKGTEIAYIRRENRELKAAILANDESFEERLEELKKCHETEVNRLMRENMELNDDLIAEEQRYKEKTNEEQEKLRDAEAAFNAAQEETDVLNEAKVAIAEDMEDTFKKLDSEYQRANLAAEHKIAELETSIAELRSENNQLLRIHENTEASNNDKLPQLQHELFIVNKERDQYREALVFERQAVERFQILSSGLMCDLKQSVIDCNKSQLDLPVLKATLLNLLDEVAKIKAESIELREKIRFLQKENGVLNFGVLWEKDKAKKQAEKCHDWQGKNETLESVIVDKNIEIQSISALLNKRVDEIQELGLSLTRQQLEAEKTKARYELKVRTLEKTIEEERGKVAQANAGREHILFDHMDARHAENQQIIALNNQCALLEEVIHELWYKYYLLLEDYRYHTEEWTEMSEGETTDEDSSDIWEMATCVDSEVQTSESGSNIEDDGPEIARELREVIGKVFRTVQVAVQMEMEVLSETHPGEEANAEFQDLLAKRSTERAIVSLGLEHLIGAAGLDMSDSQMLEDTPSDHDDDVDNPSKLTLVKIEKPQSRHTSPDFVFSTGNGGAPHQRPVVSIEDVLDRDPANKLSEEELALLNTEAEARFAPLEKHSVASNLIDAKPPVRTKEEFLRFKANALCVWCASPRHQVKSHCLVYKELKKARKCEACRADYGEKKTEHDRKCPLGAVLELMRYHVLREVSASTEEDNARPGSGNKARARRKTVHKTKSRVRSRRNSPKTTPKSTPEPSPKSSRQ